MKLKYKILWIENEETYYEGIKDEIIEIVNSYGFDIGDEDITYCETDSDFGRENYTDYDIILIDWNLGSEKGDTIIEKIRNRDIYNEILFYSQDGAATLRKSIADKQIEGVFCCDRRQLVVKFEKIFEVNIRKILDLNNLRGLVMAEVSDLDNLKCDIIRLAYEKGMITDVFFREKVYPSIINKYWEDLIDLKKYSGFEIKTKYVKEPKDFPEKSIDKFLSDIKFNIEFKIRALKKLIEELNISSNFDDNDYRTQIQRKRNKLAHVVEEWIEKEGKTVQILKDTDFEFSFDEVKKILDNIKKYKTILDDLKNSIESLQPPETSENSQNSPQSH